MSVKTDIRKVLIALSNESQGQGYQLCEHVTGKRADIPQQVYITPYLERIMKIVEADDGK